MKKSSGSANDRKNHAKNEDAPISDLESQINKAHPLIQSCISELKKEIARLHKQNTKQEVAYFSALEKLKAEHAEQMKAKPMVTIVTAGDAHKSSKS